MFGKIKTVFRKMNEEDIEKIERIIYQKIQNTEIAN